MSYATLVTLVIAFIFAICLLIILFICILNAFSNRLENVENECSEIKKLLRENITEGIVGLHNHIDSSAINKE